MTKAFTYPSYHWLWVVVTCVFAWTALCGVLCVWRKKEINVFVSMFFSEVFVSPSPTSQSFSLLFYHLLSFFVLFLFLSPTLFFCPTPGTSREVSEVPAKTPLVSGNPSFFHFIGGCGNATVWHCCLHEISIRRKFAVAILSLTNQRTEDFTEGHST